MELSIGLLRLVCRDLHAVNGLLHAIARNGFELDEVFRITDRRIHGFLVEEYSDDRNMCKSSQQTVRICHLKTVSNQLTTHRAFSLQEGLATPKDLVQAAQVNNMPAPGLTDHNLSWG